MVPLIATPRVIDFLCDRDGGKIDFFYFLSIRPVLSIIDKKFRLSIKNRFYTDEVNLKKVNNKTLTITTILNKIKIIKIAIISF